jgi:diguanylate cyclase (GGDEF)-like protein
MALVQAPADEPHQVATALQASPALSGHLLATVNSPAFGLVERVETIERAVLLLGGREARRLGLAQAMATLAASWQLEPQLAQAWWHNSLRKATLAQRVAGLIEPVQAEQAYALALLQDIGLVGLAGIDAQLYAQPKEPVPPTELLRLERQHFGFDHATAGRSLLMRWQAPKWLWQATAQHHAEPRAADPTSRLWTALHYASLLPHLSRVWDAESWDQLQQLHAGTPEANVISLRELIDQVDRDVAALGADAEQTDPDRFQQELMQATAGELRQASATICRLRRQTASEQARTTAFEHEASHDPLTKLYNRRGLIREVQARCCPQGHSVRSVLCVVADVDDFKIINDQYGHAVGDRALRQVAHLLANDFGDEAVIGRLGGDEFVVMLWNLNAGEARSVSIGMASQTSIPVRQQSLPLSLSVGAIHIGDGVQPQQLETLVDAADRVMYQTKREGSSTPGFQALQSLGDGDPALVQGAAP